MKYFTKVLFVGILFACSPAGGEERQMNEISERAKAALRGERIPGIPEDWVGTPTKSSKGFRWDDPNNPGNSIRFFWDDPSDPHPSHQKPFVIHVRDGKVLDVDGNPITDQEVVAEALQHI